MLPYDCQEHGHDDCLGIAVGDAGFREVDTVDSN